MYPNHCNTNCPAPCPPNTNQVCPPQTCPPPPCPAPPKNWCIPGERGPRGEQGPRGYTGADGTNGKSAAVNCCRFTGGNFTNCITTLTPTSGVDRQALEALVVEMKAANCKDGFILMTKVDGALAKFCYVCDGKGGEATVKPAAQYRSGVFSYGAKSAFGVDFNPLTTGIDDSTAVTANNPTAFVHRGYLAPGNADLLSNEPVYSIVPYKNGANMKAYSWNWTGTPGMSIYFNLVAFKCDSSGAQYAEVYGPKVQGVNNTSTKLKGNSQTYYVIGSRCGCQEIDFKMPCGSNLAVYIRDIKRTNTVTANTASTASWVSDSLNCIVPTDIKSMVVCDIVLENLAYLTCEGKPEFVVTRNTSDAGSFDLALPYATLNYATGTAATHDTWQGITGGAKDCLEFVELHPFIEYVSKSSTKDIYYLLATARRVQSYTNTDIPSNHNKMYKLLITQEVDKGAAPSFFAWASTTSSIIPSATNKIKITASSRVYAYPMNDMVSSPLPVPGILPTRAAGTGGRNDVARFMNNLTMSLEFCQLDESSKLPYQVSTVAPTTLPLTSKKAWPELRSTTNKIRTVNEVADIIKKERSDLSLTFKYIKNGETYTQPSSTTVIIFTSGDADAVTGYAIVSYTHAPILG